MGIKEKLADALADKQKEQVFHGILKSRLVLLGYTVAVPEPDIGEDLWIGESVDKSRDRRPRTVYRAQLKSARTTSKKEQGKCRHYDTNEYVTNFQYGLWQPRFVYVFGLYDEAKDDKFHIGCVPSLYFRKILERYPFDRDPYPGVQGDRYMMQFYVGHPDFFYRLNIRRGATFDVSAFFGPIEYGLKVASERTPCPDLQDVSLRPHVRRKRG